MPDTARDTLMDTLRPGLPVSDDLWFGIEGGMLISGNISTAVVGPITRVRLSVLLTISSTEEIEHTIEASGT